MQTISKQIAGFDQKIQDDWSTIQARKRELSNQLDKIYSEQAGIEINLGRLVAEGESHKKYTSRLAEIEREIKALSAGIKYLDGQSELLRRSNTWLER